MAVDSSIERLSERTGVGSAGRRIGRSTLTRLLAYYTATLPLVGLFAWLTSGPLPQRPHDPAQLNADVAAVPPLLMLAEAAAAVLGAFMMALPVAFVYVRTRSSLKYDRGLVQTVIMLPVVVTTILLVVQNSLALAFSLTGIVAAVRFKNDLEEARDAVYIFAAVGLGFAAGVRQLPIAAFLSVVFATLELLLWKFDVTGDHEHTFGLVCGPEDAPPPRAEGARPVPPTLAEAAPAAAHHGNGHGHHDVVAALPPEAVGERRKGERLRVYVTEAPSARTLVERVLDRTSKRWRLLEQRAGGVDQLVLDYDLRLRRDVVATHVIDRLYAEGGAEVVAAEVLKP